MDTAADLVAKSGLRFFAYHSLPCAEVSPVAPANPHMRVFRRAKTVFQTKGDEFWLVLVALLIRD